jgi:hypothetical protein
MKRFLLAGASLLALLVGSPAEAATLMFGYTGAIVPYVVPETGTYQIIAWGAEGGGSPGSAVGGLGAEIGGDVSLLANTRLEILVGQIGASGKEKYAGGGVGSFVFLKIGASPLIAASGGGGAGGPGATQNPNKGQNGYDGRTVGTGSDGFGMVIHRGSGGYGGGGGTGGGAYQTGGGGGAGALGGGTNGTGGAIGGNGGGGHSYSAISAVASAMPGAVRADLAGVAEAALAALVLFLRTIPMAVAAVAAVGAGIAVAAAVRERTPANTAGAEAGRLPV